jgi:hypothetical protein
MTCRLRKGGVVSAARSKPDDVVRCNSIIQTPHETTKRALNSICALSVALIIRSRWEASNQRVYVRRVSSFISSHELLSRWNQEPQPDVIRLGCVYMYENQIAVSTINSILLKKKRKCDTCALSELSHALLEFGM